MRWTVLAVLFVISPPDAAKPIAIKNATIVVAPGRILEKASVLLRNGLIEDVGAQIVIPRDAEVLDGAGLTVYSGFIDGRSTIGLSDTKRSSEQQKLAEGDKPDFAREAPPHMEQANRKGLRPELDGAEI